MLYNHPERNIHNPVRYPDETQEEYKSRRNLSKKEIKTLKGPANSNGLRKSR